MPSWVYARRWNTLNNWKESKMADLKKMAKDIKFETDLNHSWLELSDAVTKIRNT